MQHKVNLMPLIGSVGKFSVYVVLDAPLISCSILASIGNDVRSTMLLNLAVLIG